MTKLNLERARREEMRWLILYALYAAQPVGTSEAVVISAVVEVIPDITELELRRELDYLEERKLIRVERNRPNWFAKINRHGIDYVEYVVDAEPGIARPAKW